MKLLMYGRPGIPRKKDTERTGPAKSSLSAFRLPGGSLPNIKTNGGLYNGTRACFNTNYGRFVSTGSFGSGYPGSFEGRRMRGAVTKRHFIQIWRAFGLRKALKVLVSRRRVALNTLMEG